MYAGNDVKPGRRSKVWKEGPERVKVSPTEAPTPTESPQPVAGSSGAALPIKTAHHGERVLETAREILACVHAICL